MDNHSKEQRHRNMAAIKNRDTKIEIILRKALYRCGYRYRKNYKVLPGKPDIALTKYKIAIFCDSEFFHGKDWKKLKEQLHKSNNSDFWIEKISKNIQRDEVVNKQLREMGWIVLRFWGKDITKNLDDCIRVIEETIFERKMNNV